ncbi:XRE family transcriptional regulator [Stenotrophomonas maltophilia]|jgi:Zn-dependent peptidase ImmA (M78 family)/DNA-binding XRE family transcriptional regulator|uniref:Helix-turn-helix domain protein n=2 Tax=Burkholderiaceae TaxID=119060 RepID=A0AAC9FRZ3_9RALS|nr:MULTISPECIES: XRE family transcriptional regulator [Pseudomonadota]MBH1608595.1 ImmA/IrrE family metallo-endopeptidase [Stenotrophomonas maltophilia]ANH73982.1 helix-turn-helix domain protein [Ralstonia insidiosa]KWR78391.1 DNA-binding protein [Cupriavidus sp. SHE]MBH1725965.1 ImmA/IrrE family metallo-endopeptidase [Stenotrophomonas maltophilia]MBH1798813.1 ImmA/IrrE family metallo-endopeptidase [Stenotrophomonas maltophilia]
MSRGGIQGFESERLSQILAARRLSQAQLASLVGVSPATVSKWRSGNQAPERETLERLAGVVNVTPEWFTRAPSAKVSLPLFRSNASAHVAARAMLEARMEWAQDVALALSEFVDYPALNLPTRQFKEPDEITPDEIELAASECRDLWRIGRTAVPDLALAIEGAGVVLIREETGISQIEGLSAWSDALGRPLVLLSADKDNGYRSRFDLAHELGHLILHRFIPRPTERDRHKQLEQQAHRFAGAFLLPAETFANEVRTPVTLDDLLLLKRRWGVSVAAIVMRLRALKILDEEAAQSLFKRRSARWGAKSEPGDGDRPPERPRLLRRTIDLLVEENVMPIDSIPRHIGLAAHDIEMLAGLSEGYFQGKPKVVQLARLRSVPSGADAPVATDSNVVPFRFSPKR